MSYGQTPRIQFIVHYLTMEEGIYPNDSENDPAIHYDRTPVFIICR